MIWMELRSTREPATSCHVHSEAKAASEPAEVKPDESTLPLEGS